MAETYTTPSGTLNEVQRLPSNALASTKPSPILFASGANATSPVIPTTSLTSNVNPIQLPQSPAQTPIGAPVAPTGVPVIQGPQQTTTITDQTTQTGGGLTDMLSNYLGNAPTPPSLTDAYAQAQQQAGIQAKQQAVNDASAQLSDLSSRAGAASLSQGLRSKANTLGAISGAQADIQRKAAIEALPLQATLQAAQGNLQAAQQNLDTAFKLKAEDLTNNYNYLKEQRAAVMQYASDQQKAELEKQNKLEDRAYTEATANSKIAQDWAKSAIDGGDAQVAAAISGLDPKSATFRSDLSALQSKITNPAVKLDLAIKQAQLNKLQVETRLLGEPTQKEKEAEKKLAASIDGQKQILQDKVNLIDTIQSNELGFNNRVGSNMLTRIPTDISGTVGRIASGVGIGPLISGAITEATGAGQAFAGGVHRLASQEFINNLISAKGQGATFGALNQQEGDALRAAATQINDWEVKDSKGNGTGVWNIDQKSFNTELNRIKSLANKAITGSVIAGEDQAILDEAFNTPAQQQQSAANYY
jgi:hypothetical protein